MRRNTIASRRKSCVRSGSTCGARLARAVDAVLAVTGHDVLLEANPVLRRSIDVRNPYVDPINLVQVELLRRLREPDPDPALFDAFVVTVNGIAAGMRNTGDSAARLDAEAQRRRETIQEPRRHEEREDTMKSSTRVLALRFAAETCRQTQER